FPDHPRLWVSLKEEKGLDKLKDEILREILQKEINPDQDIFITRVRHKNALEQALEAINRVKQAYDNNTPNDFLTIDLKECLDKIGEITGETVTEDIVERIFSDFCIGK
ncbi:MAG: tRNA uridine-5-carboxymethylaminomethyl(34) synthesis GTPase MnmE, partial [Bacillota bacterium]